MRKILSNAIGFQLAWWACIAGAAYGYEWAAIGFCAVLAALHFSQVSKPRAELQLVTSTWLMGMAMDTILQLVGVIEFKGAALGPLSPYWLWVLWAMFAMTLNVSMAFLQHQPGWVCALLGAIFGPISYYGGAQVGAATGADTPAQWLLIGLEWMLLMPLLIKLARRTQSSESLPLK